MREIKFRVYYEFIFQGRVKKGMASPASWFLLSQTGKLWTYEPDSAPQPLDKAYIKAIPLFYIGLKDKNEVEIYEGDIIMHPFEAEYNVGVVEMNQGHWSIGQPSTGLFNVDELYEDDWNKCEVIGNIYENPELLEKK